MVILVCAIARWPATSIDEPPRKCRMLTPLFQPSRLTSIKRSAGPWNQVAIIRPSGCHTLRKRSQSPASRQSAQFSTTSRMRNRSIIAASISIGLFPRILDVRKLVELDVIERPVDFLHAPNVHRLDNIASLGIDHDRATGTHELH